MTNLHFFSFGIPSFRQAIDDMRILGLDIGGANIKAANDVGLTINRPFEIWNHRDKFKAEIESIFREYPDADRVAVTMTAELADCFETKSEGVRFILDTIDECARNSFPVREPALATQEVTPGIERVSISRDKTTESVTSLANEKQHNPHGIDGWAGVIVWTTEGRFVSSSEARMNILKVAAANWHALATWCGRLIPNGASLLIDIGTTTTDIIPIIDGVPKPVGLTDLARLQSGELSYSGVRRTPICAVAHSVPFRDGYCSLAAELFATTLDIYLLLGLIPEDSQNVDTANGKPATVAAAHDRLARMLCCDREEVPFDEAVQVARFLADVQRQRLAGALERVVHRLPPPCQNLILSGSGAFLAHQLIYENRHTTNGNATSLASQFSPGIGDAACAYAVAQLATMR